MRRSLPATVWLGFLALDAALMGCKSADQAHQGYLASVEIVGHEAAEIRQATTKVFAENGYERVAGLVFEKKGSTWNSLAYGGWSRQPVWVRVRVSLRPHRTGRQVLGCDAYLVRDRNGDFLEEERKPWVSRRGECERILNQIKARLELQQPVPKP